jgi:hypothetical protein
LKEKEKCMTLDEVILELYRLAETKEWGGKNTDAALAAAIEGMEQIWTLRQADRRRSTKNQSIRRQQRIWS